MTSRFPRPALVTAMVITIAAAPLLARIARSACPGVSVQAPVQYPTGRGPVEAVAADFNGDGIPDLAVTASHFDTGPGAISVLPGLAPGGVANGTFGPRIDTNIGGVPLGLATADLNGDGRPDLVVGDWLRDSVVVLLGTGGGHFAAPLSFAAGRRPYEVLTGDFNGDGVLDVAVADNGEPNIRVLIGGNDGSGHWNGTFAHSVAYPTSDLSLAITSGDFNGDGIPDLVATEYLSQTVALFLGNGSAGHGDGTFQPALHIGAGPEPYDLATGDLNGDGHLDLVVDESSNGGVRVLLGSGTGYFPVSTSYLAGVNCSGVTVADLDGDGIPDIAAGASVANALNLLKGVGDGTFAAPVTLGDCCFPLHIMSADLDLDGRADLVSCDYQSDAVAVFLDGCTADTRPPHIARIRDVPNDQGGKVFITWTRSSLDVPAGAVNAYRVWRMVPPGVAAARALPAPDGARRTLRSERVTHPDGTSDLVFWEALATLPAQRLAGYGYTAATTQDSLPGGNPYFTFRISALTSNIDEFYDSDPDSGYSVDNIAPVTPSSFTVARAAGANQLRWDPSPDADFASFRLYRSSDPSFVPSAATLVATLTSTSYVDPRDASGSYMLSAVDKHGNISGCATALLSGTTGVPGSSGETRLAAPSPNPMRGTLDVRCTLAHAGEVSLAIYDQQGRRVRTLLAGAQPAGDVVLRWDARDDAGHAAGPGLYFLELRADGRKFVQRVAMVR